MKIKGKISKKKAVQLFLGSVFLFILGFRFTPHLLPITEKKLQRESFHSVKFFDRDGRLLQEVLSENSSRSIHIDLDRISPYFLKAIISSEDKDFYHHKGIDYRAILRAACRGSSSLRIIISLTSSSKSCLLSFFRNLSIFPKNLLCFSKAKTADASASCS